MKKLIVCVLSLSLLFTGCKANVDNKKPDDVNVTGNYSDEMKIPYAVDLAEDGADSVERQGDQ